MDEQEKNRPEEPSEQTAIEPIGQAEPSQPFRSPRAGGFQAPVPGPAPQFNSQPLYAPPVDPEARPERRRSFVGPLILIFLGIIFLLNNLGLVGWSVWEILWRFWPVWLIAIGVDMLFGRRSRSGGLLALALVLTMLGGVFYYASLWTDIGTVSWPSSEREGISQSLGGAREARVEIKAGVSRLDLAGGADTGSLVQGTVVPIGGERLDRDFRVSGATAYYKLSSEFNGIMIPFGDRSGQGRWSLRLNEQTPMALTIETGVGKSDLDLSHLTVTDLRVSSGVGETTLTLPARGQLRAKLSAGVGQTTVRLPEGMAARIRVQTGMGGVSVRGDFDREGSFYVTPNYNGAANRIDIEVDGGVGGIRIETVR